MASPLRYALVADGTSDRALLPIIDWVLRSHEALAGRMLESQLVNPGLLASDRSLRGSIGSALRHFQPNLLFVHRDAEASDRATTQHREEEIREAMTGREDLYIPVIPIRMMEAWLLIDVAAVRRAADNPNGEVPLDLPRLRDLESCPDPKTLLHRLLEKASELTGRRLHKFQRDLPWRCGRIAELIEDFSPLQKLSAFQRFRTATQEVLARLLEGEDEP